MKFLFSFCLLLSMTAAASAQTTGPAETLAKFFAFDRKHSTEFSVQSVESRKAWFSNELYSLLKTELKREAEYLKENPGDKPHFGDGLPFRPLDETCDVGQKKLHKRITFKSGPIRGSRAAITATFAFPRPCETPDKNVYVFSMKRIANRWTIDNVTYDDGSTLVGDLKRKEY